uniref:BHLH domain-containing protein n=1 Tax=Stegastes partitus TaxID=144197 RepID=A0A3B4ZML0_9TELE
MRAALPVRPAGSRRRSSGTRSCFLPPVPVLLLRDMELCYRLLGRLVPALMPGMAASKVEILQHVIDYMLELQSELDASCPAGQREDPHLCDRQQQLQQRPQSPADSR